MPALMRRPRLDTVLNLWVTGRVDLRNGSLFDLVRAPHRKCEPKMSLRTLDKGLALRVAARFLLVPRGGPWPLDHVRGDRPRRRQREHQPGKHPGPLRPVERVLLALSRSRHGLHLRVFRRSGRRSCPPRSTTSWKCRAAGCGSSRTRRCSTSGAAGGFICYAAQHYGVRAHGATLSQQQYDYAREKIARLNLQDRVTAGTAGLCAGRRQLRQDRFAGHVRARRHRQPSGLFPDHQPSAETRRTLSASRHQPAGQRQ